MKAIERLYQYFDYKNIKPTRFEKDFGLSNGYFGGQLKREADIGSSILEKIVDNCRDLSIDWLITGKGNMLIAGDQVSSLVRTAEKPNRGHIGSSGCERCKIKDELIESLRQTIESTRLTIDAQTKLISHLEENKSPIEIERQKRKAV